MSKKTLKQELIREVRNNFAEINVRYIESEGSEEAFFSGYNEKFKALTKTKNTRKISTGNLSKMNKQQLQDILFTQEKFLSDKLSTETGRKYVQKIRKKNLEKKFKIKLTDKQYKKLGELLDSDEVKQIIENNKLDSDQIISLVKEFPRKNIKKVIGDIARSENYNDMSPQDFIDSIYESLQRN